MASFLESLPINQLKGLTVHMNDRVLQSSILIPLNMEVQFAVELIIYHKIHNGDKVNLKSHSNFYTDRINLSFFER